MERIKALAQKEYDKAMAIAEEELDLDTLESYRSYFGLTPYIKTETPTDFLDTECNMTDEDIKHMNPFKNKQAYNMFNKLIALRRGLSKFVGNVKVIDDSEDN